MVKVKLQDAYMVVCEWYDNSHEYYVFDKIEDAKDCFRSLMKKGLKRSKTDENGYTIEECIAQNHGSLDGRYIHITECKVLKEE